MKLYIKQKALSFRDRFMVADERMDILYTVEGEIFAWGKKLHVYDASDKEVAFIRQKVWSFLTRFFIEIEGRPEMEVVKEFTFMRPRYRIGGLRDWCIEGDVWAHEYEILDTRGNLVMRMSKRWFTWGDSYELFIERDEDALPCVCAALAVDAAMAVQAAASSGSGAN